MADKQVSFRVGQEESLCDMGVNNFSDGAITFGYSPTIHLGDDGIQDGRLYIDLALNGMNYRIPLHTDCSYHLKDDQGYLYDAGSAGTPVYFLDGVPVPVSSNILFYVDDEQTWYDSYGNNKGGQ